MPVEGWNFSPCEMLPCSSATLKRPAGVLKLGLASGSSTSAAAASAAPVRTRAGPRMSATAATASTLATAPTPYTPSQGA